MSNYVQRNCLVGSTSITLINQSYDFLNLYSRDRPIIGRLGLVLVTVVQVVSWPCVVMPLSAIEHLAKAVNGIARAFF